MTRSPSFVVWMVVGLVSATVADAVVRAQIAVSANDNKAVLVDGVNTVVTSPPPDTITLLDLSVAPARIVGQLQAPNSIVGPPQNVAIAPGGALALISNSTKIDPADATKTVPDDLVSVIDLKAAPPKVTATLHAGRGASGASFSPDGTLAMVANRMAGTISVFSVQGGTVTSAGTVDLGAPDSGPSHVVFSRDGKSAYVTRNNDNLISLLTVTGRTVTYTKRDIASSVKPYGIDITPAGDLAVVGHIGAGAAGGVDTVALVDLAEPFHVIDQIAAGIVVEGIAISPDGQFVAATVMNGSNQPKSSAFYHPTGRLRVFSLAGKKLTSVAEAATGVWCQGAAWSRDSHTLFVQCAADKNIKAFTFDGRTLRPAGTVAMPGMPSGIGVGK